MLPEGATDMPARRPRPKTPDRLPRRERPRPEPMTEPRPPTVSVVIPYFRRPETILRAVDSALDQTRPPLEVIVVDDGSGDDVGALLDADRAARGVRLERLPGNRGGGHARNTGIALARGDLVALLDADDSWAPDHLELLSGAAKGLSGDFLLAASIRVSTRPDRIWPARRFQTHSACSRQVGFLLSQPHAFQSSTLLMPRETAVRFAFDRRLRRHQDWDVVTSMIAAGVPIRLLTDPTVTYFQDGSVTVSRTGSLRPSLRFLTKHRALIPLPALIRFHALQIVPRQPRSGWRQPAWLAAGMLSGGITLREGAFYLRRWLRSGHVL